MRRCLALLTVCLALSACGGVDPPAQRLVVVIQDGAVPDARSVVSPAVLGLSLALADASANVQVIDVTQAGALPAMRPAAVVIAPFTPPPDAVVNDLIAAGIPVLSLSELGSVPSVRGPWRRFVPALSAQVAVLGRSARTSRACLGGEDSAVSATVTGAIRAEASTAQLIGSSPDQAADSAIAAECRLIVWTGSAPGASSLREALDHAGGAAIRLVLGDAARTQGYLDAAFPAALGDVGVCPCVDLGSTGSIAPPARAFAHDFTADTGLQPGPFAAEGYDAGTLLLAWLSGNRWGDARKGSLTGIGGSYRWDDRGELADPHIRSFRALGVRWVEA
jgi:hypothetical protein